MLLPRVPAGYDRGAPVGIFMVTPWTLGLLYDRFDESGNLDVRITFDHRVVDGIAMAGILRDLEEEARGPILRELRALRRHGEAA
jgi:hypothetical protein